jgi:lipopolysaccharide transport system ATP-binding protein
VSSPSVVVEGVSKKFGLSVKSALKYGLIDSGRRLMGKDDDHRLRPGEFWALNNVSFSLEPGDALGIMGINGSGKTTLLRILNGTYGPDQGKATLRGRIGALIAAGAGFSPLLSGRENVFISGTLLGMTPREIKRRFDEIVAFAELGDFIDMPVRNYSSGMSVRLGFAIAVIGTPEILLVDEVLAVGDINFQKKCFERIHFLKQQGTTILLVSHSPGAIWSVCTKGLVLHRGATDGIVAVEDACRLYDHFNMLERLKSSPQPDPDHLPSEYGGKRGGTGDVVVTKLEILDAAYKPVTHVAYGDTFILRHYVDVRSPIRNGIFRTQVDAEINKAIAIVDSYEAHNSLFSFDPGKYVIDIEVKCPNLRPGVYEFCPSVTEKTLGVHLFYQYGMGSLQITHPSDVFFYADYRASVHLNASYAVRRQESGDRVLHVH